MRIFVTGASGFIGSAVVAELIGAGHRWLGWPGRTRRRRPWPDAAPRSTAASLDDPDSLRQAAETLRRCDPSGVSTTISTISRTRAELDRRAIEALGEALAGSDRPLVVAGGILWLSPGRPSPRSSRPRRSCRDSRRRPRSALTDRGVRTAVVRLPPSVHGEGDHGFVPRLIEVAREKGVSAYLGDGTNRWPAVHRLDAARVFRLAVESAPAGSILQAVDDEGVPVRAIAETIGKHLDAAGHIRRPRERLRPLRVDRSALLRGRAGHEHPDAGASRLAAHPGRAARRSRRGHYFREA